jgi:hypothetical protein
MKVLLPLTALFALATLSPAQQPDAPQLNFSSFEKRLTDLEHRVAAVEQKAGASTGVPMTGFVPYPQAYYPQQQTYYYPQQQVFYPQQNYLGGDFAGGACAGGNCGGGGGQQGYRFAPFGGRFRVFR